MTATLVLRGRTDRVNADGVNAAGVNAAGVNAAGVNAAGVTARRPRPRGLDRAVIVLGVAMLRWAGKRADRGLMTREEHARAFATVCDAERRMLRTQSMAMRVS
jgi:hypothetical protein